MDILAGLIILAIAYAYSVEGLFTACTMFINVLLAGMFAFNFWEPLADMLEPELAGAAALGYEDALVLVLLFWLALGSLRLVTNQLANAEIEMPLLAQRIGGAVFGLLTGYLVCGFLACVLQTLPWHENFMGFEPKYEQGRPLRRVLPPDRVWLAFMHRVGAGAFSQGSETFDKDGSFALRYARYRRYTATREPLPYHGEFESQERP